MSLRSDTAPVRSTGERIAVAWSAASPATRFGSIAFAVVGASCALSSSIPVAAAVGVTSVVPAAVVDLHERRLPNSIVGLGLLLTVGVGAVEATVGGGFPFASVTLGALAASLPLLVLHVCSPGSMGFGDVKLGAVVGTALGAVDWRLTLWMLVVASAISVLTALVLRVSTVAFGPGLIVASILILSAIAVTPHAFQLPGR